MSNDRNEVVLNVYGVMGRQEIVRGGIVEHPILDADGSQTDITTSTGRWLVEYNGENRPVMWTRVASNSSTPNSVTPTLIPMSYDRMGRRVRSSEDTFVYDGYLNIGSTIWDPTEPVATRPLVWLNGNVPSYYFHDANKSVTDLIGETPIHYIYAPFGVVVNVTSASTVFWGYSSEHTDVLQGTMYYNYRHLSIREGRWMGRDPVLDAAFRNSTVNAFSESVLLKEDEKLYYDLLRILRVAALIDDDRTLFSVQMFINDIHEQEMQEAAFLADEPQEILPLSFLSNAPLSSSDYIGLIGYQAGLAAAGACALADGPVPIGDLIGLGIVVCCLVDNPPIPPKCPPPPSPPPPEIHNVPNQHGCPRAHWHYFVYHQSPWPACKNRLQRRFGGCVPPKSGQPQPPVQ